MSDFIWFFVGFSFGVVFMLNRKEYKDRETFEQVNEKVRNELAVNKNLVDSLKKDLQWTKQKLEAVKNQ